LSHAAWEIGGAVMLGLVIGGPAAMLTGRLHDGEPLQIEALSLVFLSAGLSLWLEVSFLITGMVVGAVIVNLAAHHTKVFHEISHIQWPFVVLFFIRAGGALDIAVAVTSGGIGLGFVVLRTIARIAGGWIGVLIAGEPVRSGPWYGVALLPQAGVAIGMSLIAAQQFAERGVADYRADHWHDSRVRNLRAHRHADRNQTHQSKTLVLPDPRPRRLICRMQRADQICQRDNT
jgi:Kef-type K+ transport system membrane component KefB